MRRVTVATVLLVVATLAPHAAADPTADLTAWLDAAVEARVAEMGVPGAIVSLSIPGEIDYARAVGVSDTATRAPMSVDDHTRIGSVTKTFTGTAVLQLVDQGRIRLSDPISRYVDGVPSGDVITLDLLGRMRSGLADYAESDVFLQRIYAEAPAGPDAFATTPGEILDWALAQPLNFPAGKPVRVLQHQHCAAGHGYREGQRSFARGLLAAEHLWPARADPDELPGERTDA
jgi:D-alanyl-D-alanine carboxypeptidase